MLDGARHVAVAVSGGKDSLSVLHILKQITKPARINLTAIAVDEGIRGYRGLLIKDAEALCKRLEVPLEVYSFKKEMGRTMDQITRKKDREISCTYCGVFRRWILNKAAKEVGADRIATGHNIDDVCQSFIMNIFRNEPFRLARFGPKGGMVEDEGFVPRIRPFFRIPEKEIALYAILMGFKSQFGGCPYVKEAFRPEVREFVNKMESAHPGAKFNILKSFMQVRPLLVNEFKKRAEEPIMHCRNCGEPTSSTSECKRCSLLASL